MYKTDPKHVITPKKIYNYIDTYVVGQHEAKMAVANAMFIHYVRYFESDVKGKTFNKSNLLLAGPSGSGKTLIVRKASEAILHLTKYNMAPMLEVDCSQLSASGWQGLDIDDAISTFVRSQQSASAESTVVFLDEIDKICMAAVGQGGTDHNRNTQYSLLKVIEGMSGLDTRGRKLNTEKMLFILAGNFPSIRHKREQDKKPKMGFSPEKIKAKDIDIHEELQIAGMCTQLAGRISMVAETDPLNKKMLRDILKSQLLPEYIGTFSFIASNIGIPSDSLKFTAKEIDKLAKDAYNKGVGARGLRGVVDKAISEKLFEIGEPNE